MGVTGNAGNRGAAVRSDCWIEIEIRESGGIEIALKSKVELLFGEDIRKQVTGLCQAYGLENVKIEMEDSGALPFTIAARFEAALSKIKADFKPRSLNIREEIRGEKARDAYRRSRLYLPGDNPKMMINAGIHSPDGIILDLEDSVAPAKKDDARFLVRRALEQVDFYGAERMVRINQLPLGLKDLEAVIPAGVNLILIPKVESAAQVQEVAHTITKIQAEHSISAQVWLMPIIESALGVIKAFEIATAAPEIVALAIGLEDYTADLGTARTDSGQESFFARSMIVNAARAAGLQPIDSVFSDVADMEALAKNVAVSKSLGFDGMGCIHPRQIPVIHDGYAPADTDIEKAKKIVLAFDDAQAKGLGVVSLGSKMIDPPVVKRALRTIDLAIRSQKLDTNWKEAK
jgi:citrate lyase subunit beta / citryl-CoA lyase